MNRRIPNRPVLVGASLLSIVLLLGGYALRSPAEHSRPMQDAVPVPAPTPPLLSRPQAAITVPSFDIVRVGPGGGAVLAGRAGPGAEVVVRDGERELGRTRADAQGQWVLTPSTPLAPGGRELTLTSRDPDGRDAASEAPVLLVVPDTAQVNSPVLAVLSPAHGPSRILQGAAGGSGRLGLDTVDYTDGGDIRFSGQGKPNAVVRVYVDNAPVGDAVADARGQWTLTPDSAIAAGRHGLRVDQLTARGTVASRVELPFERSVLPPGSVQHGRVVVQPGQNLWRLAREAYGQGLRYTVIYLANREQIRDPRLIYPGQAFALPAAMAGASE